jgi:hypothetical protein
MLSQPRFGGIVTHCKHWHCNETNQEEAHIKYWMNSIVKTVSKKDLGESSRKHKSHSNHPSLDYIAITQIRKHQTSLHNIEAKRLQPGADEKLLQEKVKKYLDNIRMIS